MDGLKWLHLKSDRSDVGLKWAPSRETRSVAVLE